jgi:hypothetical protein
VAHAIGLRERGGCGTAGENRLRDCGDCGDRVTDTRGSGGRVEGCAYMLLWACQVSGPNRKERPSCCPCLCSAYWNEKEEVLNLWTNYPIKHWTSEPMCDTR